MSLNKNQLSLLSAKDMTPADRQALVLRTAACLPRLLRGNWRAPEPILADAAGEPTYSSGWLLRRSNLPLVEPGFIGSGRYRLYLVDDPAQETVEPWAAEHHTGHLRMFSTFVEGALETRRPALDKTLTEQLLLQIDAGVVPVQDPIGQFTSIVVADALYNLIEQSGQHNNVRQELLFRYTSPTTI